MKLKLSQKNAAAKLMPEGYAADVMSAGVVEGEHLIISDADYLRLTLKYAPRVKDFKTERESICRGCEWNIGWLCEHSGCRPCHQRAKGGLLEVLSHPNAHCPAAKW